MHCTKCTKGAKGANGLLCSVIEQRDLEKLLVTYAEPHFDISATLKVKMDIIRLTFNLPFGNMIHMMGIGNKYSNEERGPDLRFNPPSKPRSFKVSKLWDIHHEICRRVALGESNVSIADALGVSPVMVSYTRNSKVAKDQVGILRGAMDADTIDLGIQIQKFAPVALKLLEDIIKGAGAGKDASIGLRARHADRYLDRAGYSPVKKIATMSTTLTREDIEAIKARSRQSAIDAGIIDIEAEE